jgi:hypothetical protein
MSIPSSREFGEPVDEGGTTSKELWTRTFLGARLSHGMLALAQAAHVSSGELRRHFERLRLHASHEMAVRLRFSGGTLRLARAASNGSNVRDVWWSWAGDEIWAPESGSEPLEPCLNTGLRLTGGWEGCGCGGCGGAGEGRWSIGYGERHGWNATSRE